MVIDIPALSRNQGYGLRLDGNVDSVDVRHGRFIQNGLGGILAPNGIRSVVHTNFENSGSIAIDVGGSPWGTTIANCEASSDGKTINQEAKAKSGAAVGPLLHLYRYGGGASMLFVENNRLSYYGLPPNPTSLRA